MTMTSAVSAQDAENVPAAEALAKEEKKICRVMATETMSRMNRRVCRTAKEWNEGRETREGSTDRSRGRGR